MTTEVFTPVDPYTVSGVGPYAFGDPYFADSELYVIVVLSGVRTLLTPDIDYTVSPTTAPPGTTPAGGNVTLTATAAAAYDGGALSIFRATGIEQGWAGITGSREKGLEQALDRLALAIQDANEVLSRTVRVDQKIDPAVKTPTGVLNFDDLGALTVTPLQDMLALRTAYEDSSGRLRFGDFTAFEEYSTVVGAGTPCIVTPVGATLVAKPIAAVSGSYPNPNAAGQYFDVLPVAGEYIARHFNAKADGVTSDSAAINAILALTDDFLVVNGEGLTYAIAGLNIRSNLRMKHFNFTHTGNTDGLSAVQTNYFNTVAPAFSFVEFEDVHIVGQRSLQSGIVSAVENGGRHGFGLRGSFSYLALRRCSAVDTAGDGLMLFTDGAATDADGYAMKHILVEECVFTGNRRHGASMDRVDGLIWRDNTITGNGLDTSDYVAGTDPDSSGKRASLEAGAYYGNGLDIEEYDAAAGSRNLFFEGGNATGNARQGFLILIPGGATADPSKRTNIVFSRTAADKGLHSATGSAIEITPNETTNTGQVFGEVTLDGIDVPDDVRFRNGTFTVRRSSIGGTLNALDYATVYVDRAYSSYVAPTGVLARNPAFQGGLQVNAQYGLDLQGSLGGGAYEPLSLIADGSASATSSIAWYTDVGKTDMRGRLIALQEGPGPFSFSFRGKLGATETELLHIHANGPVYPGTDNTAALGWPSDRWSVVYAGTGTINTSDQRDKQDVSSLDAAELRVAARLKALFRKFRFRDAVKSKGDAARIHVGVMAQDVKAAFEAEGLDGTQYGVLCYDKWDARAELLDDDGKVVVPARAAGDRWGVRYDELLAFIIAAS